MKTSRLSKKGFTLAEMMVTSVIFSFIMAGLYTTFLAGNISWQSYDATARSQRSIRTAISFLSQDLRMADISNLVQQSTSVSFQVDHPSDGTITYSWATTGSSANQIIRTRQSDSQTWIVAQDISAFTVDTTSGVVFNITASAQTAQGQTSTFQLAAKVDKR